MGALPDSNLPTELSQKLRELGALWASSGSRPRLTPEMKKHWDSLIHAWADSDLPIAVRKSGGVRGGMVVHHSGRQVVQADNSPAQWAFTRAFAGYEYSLADIGRLLERDEIPFAFATKSSEKAQMRFRCTLSSADNVNKRGWKLCHIQEVGLNTRVQIQDLAIETLKEHFCYLLKPGNHFLIPLDWAGLGEVPEVIEQIRRFEIREVA